MSAKQLTKFSPSALWAAAVEVPYDVSERSAFKLRAAHPEATPAQLVDIAHRRFIRRVSAESAAVGGAAAFPGAGTAVSAAASAAQLTAFIAEASHHALVVAHLHGLDIRDPAKRTALVLASLTGQEGADVISRQVGIQALAWFRTSFLDIRTISAEQFNSLMLRWIRKRVASSAVSSTLGRLIPFGIGAVVGWGVGSSLAKKVVEGLNIALGEAPLIIDVPVTVDIDTTDEGDIERRFTELQLPH
ncbi:hypothetical protein [Schaalia suimastitidis]|uniref:hypothetical protein n=1 Tax=Schaalia suimastitidis TaxID=121163 RepID=UPI000419715F|nr:hypothetical protein [Schaalia suimastitidis]